MPIFINFKKWNKADFTLLAAGGFFLIAVAVKLSFPNTFEAKLLLTVSEAGLVGGIADWFAVTALFRRPLGFPYHTALIPRNRERLTNALAKAVEEDFLSKKAIRKRLAETRLIDWLISKIENESGVIFVRKALYGLTQMAIAALNPERIGRYGEELIKKMSKKEPITPYLLQLSNWALTTGKLPLLYDFLLNELTALVGRTETRNKLYHYLHNFKSASTSGNWFSGLVSWIMEKTNSLNLDEAANILQTEILLTLKDAKDANHPLRLWFLEQMSAIVKTLSTNDVWAKAIEESKNGFLTKFDLASPIASAVRSFQETASKPLSGKPNQLKEKIVDLLMSEAIKSWQIFKADAKMKEEAEKFFRDLTDDLLEKKHNLVGIVVANALSQLTDEGMIRFVEEKVGDDLAWIRINGVIVGSIAGLILGLFLHFVYDPFLKSFNFF